MLFVLKKDLSKYVKQNNTSHENFVKRRARQFVPYLIFGVVKNWRLSAEAIFAQKKIIMPYLKKPWWFRLQLD